MGEGKGKKRHVLAVPFPAQGHVTPLLKLSRLIASHGIKVTFVNTQFIHNKILRSTNPDDYDVDGVVLTSIPDGLAADEDRNDALKLFESLQNTMGGYVKELVEKINGSDEKISCIIADLSVGSVLDVAEGLGAEPVGFTPASAACLALALQVPNLIQQGVLDLSGSLRGSEIISLSDNIPPWKKDEYTWSFPTNLEFQKILLEFCFVNEKTARSRSSWLLSNTSYELESSACDLNPKLLPVGPFLNTTKFKANPSSFYNEDTSCLRWLDEREVGSVIYVSFGSVAVFSQHQLDELALGLELSGRPFLWVIRSSLTDTGSRVEYPEGFLERVCGGGFGKIVEWAPQEKVLSHPSVGCFMSHCGWNSTLEGLTAGLPFLCWPYFVDQFHNQSYICDEWKIGLRIEGDGEGIRVREEVKKKIEMVFGDEVMRANALWLKAMVEESVAHGSSFMNLRRFIDHLLE